MEYTISSIQNDPIIRKHFLQQLDDISFVEKHSEIIHKVIWLPNEVHKNMIYAYGGKYMEVGVLRQCLEFVKQLFSEYTPIIYINYLNNKLVDELNIESCHYLIDNYPNEYIDYDVMNYIEKFDPIIMERILKNKELDCDNFNYVVNYIIKSQRMDHFILLPLSQHFAEYFPHNIKYIKNIDILDYVLNNFNIKYSSETIFKLLKNFNYESNIINRFMAYGLLDIYAIYKKCNFVKLLYYTLCIKNKETADLLASYVVLDNDLFDNIKACIKAIKLLEHPKIIINNIFVDQVTTHLYTLDKKLIKEEAMYIYKKIDKIND